MSRNVTLIVRKSEGLSFPESVFITFLVGGYVQQTAFLSFPIASQIESAMPFKVNDQELLVTISSRTKTLEKFVYDLGELGVNQWSTVDHKTSTGTISIDYRVTIDFPPSKVGRFLKPPPGAKEKAIYVNYGSNEETVAGSGTEETASTSPHRSGQTPPPTPQEKRYSHSQTTQNPSLSPSTPASPGISPGASRFRIQPRVPSPTFTKTVQSIIKPTSTQNNLSDSEISDSESSELVDKRSAHRHNVPPLDFSGFSPYQPKPLKPNGQDPLQPPEQTLEQVPEPKSVEVPITITPTTIREDNFLVGDTGHLQPDDQPQNLTTKLNLLPVIDSQSEGSSRKNDQIPVGPPFIQLQLPPVHVVTTIETILPVDVLPTPVSLQPVLIDGNDSTSAPVSTRDSETNIDTPSHQPSPEPIAGQKSKAPLSSSSRNASDGHSDSGASKPDYYFSMGLSYDPSDPRAPFRCQLEECETRHKSEADLIAHVTKEHDPLWKIYTCVCGEHFSQKEYHQTSPSQPKVQEPIVPILTIPSPKTSHRNHSTHRGPSLLPKESKKDRRSQSDDPMGGHKSPKLVDLEAPNRAQSESALASLSQRKNSPLKGHKLHSTKHKQFPVAAKRISHGSNSPAQAKRQTDGDAPKRPKHTKRVGLESLTEQSAVKKSKSADAVSNRTSVSKEKKKRARIHGSKSHNTLLETEAKSGSPVSEPLINNSKSHSSTEMITPHKPKREEEKPNKHPKLNENSVADDNEEEPQQDRGVVPSKGSEKKNVLAKFSVEHSTRTVSDGATGKKRGGNAPKKKRSSDAGTGKNPKKEVRIDVDLDQKKDAGNSKRRNLDLDVAKRKEKSPRKKEKNNMNDTDGDKKREKRDESPKKKDKRDGERDKQAKEDILGDKTSIRKEKHDGDRETVKDDNTSQKRDKRANNDGDKGSVRKEKPFIQGDKPPKKEKRASTRTTLNKSPQREQRPKSDSKASLKRKRKSSRRSDQYILETTQRTSHREQAPKDASRLNSGSGQNSTRTESPSPPPGAWIWTKGSDGRIDPPSSCTPSSEGLLSVETSSSDSSQPPKHRTKKFRIQTSKGKQVNVKAKSKTKSKSPKFFIGKHPTTASATSGSSLNTSSF